MPTVRFIIEAKLPKTFTRREFNLVIRDYSITSHPGHHLQRMVEKGILKHKSKGLYEQVKL